MEPVLFLGPYRQRQKLKTACSLSVTVSSSVARHSHVFLSLLSLSWHLPPDNLILDIQMTTCDSVDTYRQFRVCM